VIEATRKPGSEAALVAQWRGVTRRFGSVTALEGFDLEIRAGEVVALLGPNGAGKTTAIHLLLGLLAPDTGSVQLNGGDPRDAATRRGVGAVLQTAGLPARLRVGELVSLFASYHAQPRPVAEVLAQVGLSGLVRRPLSGLSGGERRRVEFALALVGNPRLLVLDEPTVGVDARERKALIDTIAGLSDGGCAVLLTTHLLEEAERLAHRVALIAGGRLRAVGPMATIKALAGARHRIKVRTQLGADALGALPGVGAVRIAEGLARLDCSDSDLALRALLAADPAAREIEVQRGDFETAYLELTAEAA
jgi:ABC-2 type transport system ATP-binding protein